MLNEINKETKLAEALERDLQTLYFEKALKCATNQIVITIKYFKTLAQAYYITESLSDNLIEGMAALPHKFKVFLEALEK